MRKLSFLVLIIPLLFISSIQSVSASRTTSVELLRLTSGFYREDWPAIYKDKILWVAEGIIYIYDVKEKTTSPFFEGTQPLTNFYALIAYDGRYIIYNQYDGISYNVSAYDTKKRKDIPITSGADSHSATDYDNNKIVFTDGGGYGDLYVYDINTKKHNLIAQNAAVPRISGRYVVWYVSTGSGTYDIRAYDLVKNELIDIPNPENASRRAPAINGDKIIYIYKKNNLNSVRLFDLNKNEEKNLIESSSYTMSWPSISKNMRYGVKAQHSILQGLKV